MGHTLHLTDEQYETLLKVAQTHGETPEELIADTIAAWWEAQRNPLTEPHYYEMDEWFRHLEGKNHS